MYSMHFTPADHPIISLSLHQLHTHSPNPAVYLNTPIHTFFFLLWVNTYNSDPFTVCYPEKNLISDLAANTYPCYWLTSTVPLEVYTGSVPWDWTDQYELSFTLSAHLSGSSGLCFAFPPMDSRFLSYFPFLLPTYWFCEDNGMCVCVCVHVRMCVCVCIWERASEDHPVRYINFVSANFTLCSSIN